MQRDWELIRRILMEVENLPSGGITQSIQIEGVDSATVAEHIKLLVNKGFLDGETYDLNAGSSGYVIKGISWEGHDFLENARNDTVWKRVMAESKAKGTSMTMVVLNGLLTKAAQKYAGLD